MEKEKKNQKIERKIILMDGKIEILPTLMTKFNARPIKLDRLFNECDPLILEFV